MVTPLQVHGADVSHHNGGLDLERAKANGLRFLYHKVTEGTSLVDEEYARRRRAAAAAGLPFGGYHFARPEGKDARAEALWFLKHLEVGPTDLVPALDLEVDGGLTPGQLTGWAEDFCDVVRRQVGVQPVLYSPWRLTGRDLVRWVPRYNRDNRRPDIPWDIFQFSGGAEFPGTPSTFPGLGAVDLNHFNDGVNLRDITLRQRPEWTFVTFNVWVGQPLDRLRANLIRLAKDTDFPDVICLQEAKRWKGSIPGYETVRADSERPEAGSTVLLVRKRALDVVREVSVEVGGPDWIGPKHGDIHQPRVFPGAVVRDTVTPGRVDVLGLHRNPGGPDSRNEAAWNAEHRAILEWADQREANAAFRPKVLLGDLNSRRGANADDPQSLASLAKRLDARLITRGIDGGLVIDGDVKDVEELEDGYGSDGHKPVRFTVTQAA